jgi:hypothetical protein
MQDVGVVIANRVRLPIIYELAAAGAPIKIRAVYRSVYPILDLPVHRVQGAIGSGAAGRTFSRETEARFVS